MSDFQITDADLSRSKFEGKVVIITGGSSGIGLATVELLGSLGATVISADINAPPKTGPFVYIETDVSQWTSLTKLFKSAIAAHGRIDFVFANAGIGPRANYLALESDAEGELIQPNTATLDVNLSSVINTATLAVHYMKTQKEGGSIVLMGSSTGLHSVRAIDYSTAKSGVLGFGRGLSVLLSASNVPIRVNILAPSWTATQVLPDLGNLLKAVNYDAQSTDVVARSAAYLFVDKKRHGEVIFVCEGKYTEIEKAILAPAYEKVKGDGPSDDEVLARIMALAG
ncbi:NAD(P)-binding protein [Didymella exigua CBS 183.55]|uniref:NAD(P)-binding protein n=1 Tax=Didymella exigua CBS 183.55 TaxID=1150837 RepID=A0A6A5RFD2_9PLEO|nr:NAD(P)-binding protein [Didymella exigua CBS 183.55]KAF1925216.1 NAD(P)-binding protein [Didymella exigua CBS 183.55]